jgi:DNA-binding winged helix-turn-helix (wHTH) protein
LETMPRYVFGPFELDSEARLLRREGEPVPLAAKTLETLMVLVENRGRLVDKEELLSRVWAGTVVEEANLTQTIFTVRKILGDSPKDHRYIATVAGRGYQFVAPVVELTYSTQATGNTFKRATEILAPKSRVSVRGGRDLDGRFGRRHCPLACGTCRSRPNGRSAAAFSLHQLSRG